MEVAPAYDHAELTTIAASNVVYELLGLFARQAAVTVSLARARGARGPRARSCARELVAEALRRIERLDADLGAVVALRAEEALGEARALDDVLAAARRPDRSPGCPC